ncbi:MAG: hypothetical protein ABR866_01390 [Candidatus Korobacteraceae bacterium]|jgi:hypothetical protein
MSPSRTLKLLAAMLVLSTLLIAAPALAQNKQVDAAISDVVSGNSQFACCAPELVPLRNPDFRPTDS